MSGTAVDEKAAAPPPGSFSPEPGLDEKKSPVMMSFEERGLGDVTEVLNATEKDLAEASELASTFTLEDTKRIMTQVHKMHNRDPNFPLSIIDKIEEFLGNDDVFTDPDKHQVIIQEMKIEAALITNNSPYAEVRSVVDNHDDPSMPCSTIRAWIIGILFSVCISFINSFFDIRMPSIWVGTVVPQLLAYPLGTFMARVLPDKGFTLFGVRHSLNPGPFNKKEHMLITIMANVAKSTPYTNYIVWIQVLPDFFNQQWAMSVGYQLTIALSTNFIGYGLAGLCRRFLVYPAYCVWPSSLVTIALNSAFHDQASEAAVVAGPFKTIWRMTRIRFFLFAFLAMFCYFWFPNYIAPVLGLFTWMTWIAPNNVNLATISGLHTGMGYNPLPTFDWNYVTFITDPLMLPFFATFNIFMGMFLSGFLIMIVYYNNAFDTAYIPINTNKPYDRFGKRFNVSRIVDENGIFDAAGYEEYSSAFLSAAQVVLYMFFFAAYTATITYGFLYHRHEITLGFRDLWQSFKKKKDNENTPDRELDVHSRLMKRYKEVPEWWYMIVLAISVAVGMVGIACWPTHTTPAVVLYGIALCLVFVIPIGIIAAMTGIEVTLNVLAEFIGGVWVEGNALAMCFFKSYGYVTCAHALSFSADLKLAHYLKIAPRFTFWAQMVPTLVSTFISVAIMQYQVHIENVCTDDAPYKFSCPGANTFFTAAVFWGTIGPRKIWGIGGKYVSTLVGFPIGIALVLIFWLLGKKWPKSAFLRNVHPVVAITGTLSWAPYNLAYSWPAVPVAAFSWLWLKKRYLGLWSKYNFVLSAAFSCGIAISAVVIFFSLQYSGIDFPEWAGNGGDVQGCEAKPCPLMKLAPGDYFGPRVGEWQ